MDGHMALIRIFSAPKARLISAQGGTLIFMHISDIKRAVCGLNRDPVLRCSGAPVFIPKGFQQVAPGRGRIPAEYPGKTSVSIFDPGRESQKTAGIPGASDHSGTPSGVRIHI
jgi:hypothetical protein